MPHESLDMRVSTYMVTLYDYRLACSAGTAGQNVTPAPDPDFSPEMIGQAHQMVDIIAEAFSRRCEHGLRLGNTPKLTA